MNKILVVEDTALIAKTMKTLIELEMEGFQVDIAETGEKAIAMMNDEYCLVLMDLCLPDADGSEICKQIKALYDVPVLSCSAMHSSTHNLGMGACAYLGKVQASGFDGRVEKPLPENFTEILNTVIEMASNQKREARYGARR